MTAIYAVNAENSRRLIDGIYNCFIRRNQIVISDGTNEWIVSQADISDLEQRLTQAINGKSNVGHSHSISDVNDLVTSLEGKSNVGHGHGISDITNLQTSLDGKANSSHSHEIADIYKTITSTVNGSTLTVYKPLETLLDERETAIMNLINGKANASHTHQATEVIYKPAEGNNAAVNVKQQLDLIMDQIQVLDSDGTRHDIFDILFGADAVVSGVIDGGLISAVGTLQTQVAAVQTQVAGIAGTNAVGNTVDAITDAADEMSDFTDVATEGRSMLDSFSDWFDGMRQRITHQTNTYTQLTNNYTPAQLSSVSNAEMLVDIQGLVTL